MTSFRGLPALLAACLCATSVAAQQKPCVTPPEAETLALVGLPEILRETTRVCTPVLPRTAFIRSRATGLIARYQAEADRAWPAARKALAKFIDPALTPLLDSDFARPMLNTLLLSQLIGRIDTRDCATIDRMASSLQPLPPSNTAGLIVAALQYLKTQKGRNGVVRNVPDLPICEPRP